MTEIRLKHDIWVMVADGEKALFLRNQGDTKFPNLEVVRELEQENPPTHEQGTDRPGRYGEGMSVRRSAVEETDWHRIAKERFADEIAALLYKYAHADAFRELVLVAPPLVLGELRKKLHKEVDSRITAEIPKTLTKHTISDIEEILTAG